MLSAEPCEDVALAPDPVAEPVLVPVVVAEEALPVLVPLVVDEGAGPEMAVIYGQSFVLSVSSMRGLLVTH